MSTQPEALRLAYECEQSGIEWRAEVHTRLQAAAELRRLHAENEAKDALLRQAVEALQAAYGWQATTPMLDAAIAAIRQHLEGKS